MWSGIGQRYCKAPGCASSFNGYGPTRRSAHREGQLHSIAEPIFWIAAVICVVAELAILRAAFKPRMSSSETPPMPHSPRGAEMMWAIIPAVALAVLLAATWRAVHH